MLDDSHIELHSTSRVVLHECILSTNVPQSKNAGAMHPILIVAHRTGGSSQHQVISSDRNIILDLVEVPVHVLWWLSEEELFAQELPQLEVVHAVP